MTASASSVIKGLMPKVTRARTTSDTKQAAISVFCSGITGRAGIWFGVRIRTPPNSDDRSRIERIAERQSRSIGKKVPRSMSPSVGQTNHPMKLE